ncbi:sodium:alanine symporter family protein [bacterium]|nr:sodium:alanine symporter family protein [bacterium]
MQTFMNFIMSMNDVLWHNYVLYIVLGTGIVFTIWSKFGQYRALTHGVAVIRGKYDHKSDPGAINHFQALSAALSATVGLGNIGGVALAIALGGPGAVFWMWMVGIFGMALKMTEVIQAMITETPKTPKSPWWSHVGCSGWS